MKEFLRLLLLFKRFRVILIILFSYYLKVNYKFKTKKFYNCKEKD